MPDCVKQQRNLNLTYAESSLPNKHQGGAFILENKVKCQKMSASKGIDTEKNVDPVSRSLDNIIKISEGVKSKLNIHD